MPNHQIYELQIELPCKVRGKPSVRVSRSSRAPNRGYFDPKYKQYCGLVGMLLRKQYPHQTIDTNFEIEVEFLFKNLKNGKPDLDNCLKSLLDILQDARIISDDRFCTAIQAKKIHGSETHGMNIWLKTTSNI